MQNHRLDAECQRKPRRRALCEVQSYVRLDVIHTKDLVSDSRGTASDASIGFALPALCAVCQASLGGEAVLRVSANSLHACSSCDSWTLLPRPTARSQAAIHDNTEYFSHPYFEKRRIVSNDQRRRCRDILRRLPVADNIGSLRGQRLLDVGCDTGTFLKVASEEAGIVPVGIDVATRSIQTALEQGVECYRTSIDEAPAHLTDFPVITAIDLIEHVPDPAAFLCHVRKRLSPGGVVYLETPNIRSMVYRFGKMLSTLTRGMPSSLFERLFPAQHVQYFTPKSLAHMAESNGFKIVRLNTRILPCSDIAAGWLTRAALGILQGLDRLLGTEILIWAILQRPLEDAAR